MSYRPWMCTIHVMIIALLALLPFILINLLFFLVVFANVWTSHWVCSNIERMGAYRIGTYGRQKLHTHPWKRTHRVCLQIDGKAKQSKKETLELHGCIKLVQ